MNQLNLMTGLSLSLLAELHRTGCRKLILSTTWASETCWVGFLIFLILKDCVKILKRGLPWWLNVNESVWQCRRHRFYLRSRKILHGLEQLRRCAPATESALEPGNPPQLLSLCSKAWETQLLKPVGLKPGLHNKRNHHSEKPMRHN